MIRLAKDAPKAQKVYSCDKKSLPNREEAKNNDPLIKAWNQGRIEGRNSKPRISRLVVVGLIK